MQGGRYRLCKKTTQLSLPRRKKTNIKKEKNTDYKSAALWSDYLILLQFNYMCLVY